MNIGLDLILYLDDGTIISQKVIKLLKEIDRVKSITEAAKNLKISYKSAWDNLNDLNIKEELIIRKKNSGTYLNDEARNLIKKYDEIQKAQSMFIERVSNKNINLEFIPKIYLKMSARNQLKVKITQIIQGAVNSDIIGQLESGESLQASVTLESQKDLDLSLQDEVYFIFKSSKAIILKEKNQDYLLPNSIKAKVTFAKIGAVNSQIVANTSDNQKITATITNEAIMDLRLSVNDEIIVIINPSDIIIAV